MNPSLDDFIVHKKVNEKEILKYQEKLPEELIDVWKTYGFGTFANAFIKVIHPDEYFTVLENSYLRYEQAIPIFATAMGDLIVWEKGQYVNLINYRKGIVHVVSSGFEFFLEDLKDESFMTDELMWDPYLEAVHKYSRPGYEECFGYTPLLGMGGAEKVENLKKVKVAEHIRFITSVMGPIR